MLKRFAPLFAVVALVSAAAFACDGDGSPAPMQTAPAETTTVPTATVAIEPTATPLGEVGGVEGFRAFAAEIQAALDAQDGAFFHDRAQLQEGICTEADVAGGIGAAPCDTVGEPWQAFQTGAWRSEGFLIPLDEDTTLLDEFWGQARPEFADQFGDGRPRVYALVLDDDEARAILTTLVERPADFAGEGPLRVVRVMSWSFDGERWRLTSLLIANVLAEEFLIPCQGALDYTSEAWERYPDPSAPRLDEELCPL